MIHGLPIEVYGSSCQPRDDDNMPEPRNPDLHADGSYASFQARMRGIDLYVGPKRYRVSVSAEDDARRAAATLGRECVVDQFARDGQLVGTFAVLNMTGRYQDGGLSWN